MNQRARHFVPDANGEPVPCDLMTWAEWMEMRKCQIAVEHLGDAIVSTIFIGLDHRFLGDGPPILWETMICGGTDEKDGWCKRYSSRADALAGHAAAVAWVMGEGKEP